MSVNGYRIHVYEKDGGWIGHADHANGRQVYSSHKPVPISDFLDAAATCVAADQLREMKDQGNGDN
jgi:hypothetical protein